VLLFWWDEVKLNTSERLFQAMPEYSHPVAVRQKVPDGVRQNSLRPIPDVEGAPIIRQTDGFRCPVQLDVLDQVVESSAFVHHDRSFFFSGPILPSTYSMITSSCSIPHLSMILLPCFSRCLIRMFFSLFAWPLAKT